MARKSPQVQCMEQMRDQIAQQIQEFQARFPGLSLLICTEHKLGSRAAQAPIAKLHLECVATDGTAKSTDAAEIS